MYHGCYRLGESDSGISSMGIFGDNLLYLNSFLMSVKSEEVEVFCVQISQDAM